MPHPKRGFPPSTVSHFRAERGDRNRCAVRHNDAVPDDKRPLEGLERHVDFEVFYTVLTEALGYGDRPKGGRPPYDWVTMFRILVLASMHNPSDVRMEFLIRDRFSWLRFLEFRTGDPGGI